MMGDRYTLDERGEPVPESDLINWAKWFEVASQPREDGQSGRHVALSLRGEPDNQVKISTVFLGVDHGWHGRVELFETMIFGQDDDGEYCDRYATRAEALVGHSLAVALVEATIAANG